MADDDQDGEPIIDEAFLRKGAETITEDDVRRIAEAETEFREKFDRPGPVGHLVSDINLLRALVTDYWEGRYRKVPWWVVAATVFSLLYVLNPADLVPDLVPIVGQLDDAIVIATCYFLIQQELQTYKSWREEQLPKA